MTERQEDVRPAAPADHEMVVHKSTRECPMVEPHSRTLCGIVRAREANRDLADAARRAACDGQTGGGGG